MKYFGGAVVLLYALVSFSGWEPFGGGEKERMSEEQRRAGVRTWTGGFLGGK